MCSFPSLLSLCEYQASRQTGSRAAQLWNCCLQLERPFYVLLILFPRLCQSVHSIRNCNPRNRPCKQHLCTARKRVCPLLLLLRRTRKGLLQTFPCSAHVLASRCKNKLDPQFAGFFVFVCLLVCFPKFNKRLVYIDFSFSEGVTRYRFKGQTTGPQFRAAIENISCSFGLETSPSSGSKLDKKVSNSEFLNKFKTKIRKLDLVGTMENNCKNLVYLAVV